MNIGIIVPARLESKRLPNKMLLDCDGKPLIKRTVENLQLMQYKFDDEVPPISVASDSNEILNLFHGSTINTIRTSSNPRNGTERCAIANQTANHDFVINVQGDHPNIPYGVVKFVYDWVDIVQDKKSLFTVSESYYTVVHKTSHFERQTIPRHIGIYGYSKEYLQKYLRTEPSREELRWDLEQNRLKGVKHKLLMSGEEPVFSIDTEKDYKDYLRWLK